MLLPNMRPVRNIRSCAKPPTRRQQWKNAIAKSVLILACGSYGLVASANDSSRKGSTIYSFNIPAVKVEQALSQLAETTGHQLLFSYALVNSLQSTAVKGDHTAPNALQLMLHKTPLTARFTERGVIVITDASAGDNTDKGRGNMNSKTTLTKRKNVLAAMVGLFAAAGGASSAMAQGDEAATAQGRIDEIIVTATKRKTSLQETAMAISVLSSESIKNRSLVGMGDYLAGMPSVSVQDRGAGQNSIVIRGIASDPQFESPAVGMYFGDTPLTDLGLGGFRGNVDIKLVDIERVEVLRGPQGTLYGDASMGGAIRVVPAKPNVNQLEGKLEASYSKTGEAGHDNNKIQAMLNIPLIDDQLAIRAVAYHHENSGYVDGGDASLLPNLASAMALGGIATSGDDIGNDEYTGFRIAALWQPTENFEVTLSYTDQEIEQDGFPEVNLETPNKFQQLRLTSNQSADRELLANDIALTNLVAEYDLGWGSLLSSTSWIKYNSAGRNDLSHIFALPMVSSLNVENEVFIEELRFVSKFDGPLQVLAGIYYTDREQNLSSAFRWSGDPLLEPASAAVLVPPFTQFSSFNPVTGQPFTTIETLSSGPENIEQKAIFGEISYDLTDQLTATLGTRYFEYDDSAIIDGFGYLFGGSISSNAETSDSGDNYKVNLSYTPNSGTLIYGQWAEGFRLGGAQEQKPAVICDTDQDGLIDGTAIENGQSLEPDELESFELGIKASLLDNHLTLNASVYRINWEGMPVTIIPPCQFGTVVNAGKSKSEGVEFEVKTSINDSLKVNLGASYNEATLSEDIPNALGFGSKGDNLPGSADFNISLGLEYHTFLAGHEAFVRGDYAYTSDFYNNFAETGEAAGGYGLLNLKAGIALKQVDVSLFVNNLTNVDDFSWVESLGGVLSQRAYRLRPRTLGLNVGYRF